MVPGDRKQRHPCSQALLAGRASSASPPDRPAPNGTVHPAHLAASDALQAEDQSKGQGIAVNCETDLQLAWFLSMSESNNSSCKC